jgi:regulator of sigma E protease
MLAGIAFNIIFAWLALSGGYMVGLQTPVNHQGFGEVQNARPMIVGVYPDSPAARAGLMGGDTVTAAQTGSATLENGADAESLQEFIAAHQEESIIFTVERAGKEETFLAKAEEGLIEGKKAVGIQLDDVGILQLPVHLALAQGALATKNLTISTAQGLSQFFGKLFTGRGDFSQVSGPIGIAQVGSQAVESGFAAAAVIAALISINLALINLIPVPGLDGGRLLFIIVEAIIRRPISQKLSIGLTLAGFALIILLMVLVTYSDIAKLIG